MTDAADQPVATAAAPMDEDRPPPPPPGGAEDKAVNPASAPAGADGAPATRAAEPRGSGRDRERDGGRRSRSRSRSHEKKKSRSKHRSDRSPKRRRRSSRSRSRSSSDRSRRRRSPYAGTSPRRGDTRHRGGGGFPPSLPARPAPTSAPPPPPLDAAAVAAAKATAAALAVKLAVETQAAALQHASRKQRELYVGNLAVGVVTSPMLTELFNGALAAVQLGGQGVAVVKVDLDSTGKFGFVQFASEDLATAALALDKVVLCGRALNVGRPKGYVEPNTTAAHQFARAGLLAGVSQMAMPGAAAALGAQAMQQAMAGGVHAHLTCVLLHNIVPCAALVPDSPERDDILADCRQECSKFGAVLDVVAPPPPADAVATSAPGRVYVRFADASGASACANGLNGRAFDGNRIATVLVSDDEFSSASQGVWTAR